MGAATAPRASNRTTKTPIVAAAAGPPDAAPAAHPSNATGQLLDQFVQRAGTRFVIAARDGDPDSCENFYFAGANANYLVRCKPYLPSASCFSILTVHLMNIFFHGAKSAMSPCLPIPVYPKVQLWHCRRGQHKQPSISLQRHIAISPALGRRFLPWDFTCVG